MKVTPTIAGLRTEKQAQAAIEGLVLANVEIIYAQRAKRRPVAPIYLSGVRYIISDPDEDWRTIYEVLRHNGGDCEDLAAWRAAELRVKGTHAIVKLRRTSRRVWHALVCYRRRVKGRRRIICEDPSLTLARGPVLRRENGEATVRFYNGTGVRARGKNATVRVLKGASRTSKEQGNRVWAQGLMLAAKTVATGYAPWITPMWNALASMKGNVNLA